MFSTRRQFLQASAAAGAALALRSAEAADDSSPVEKSGKPMTILVLGGTGFLGPHVVEYAVARGHTVTLFNRGRTNPHLFPDLEKLQGDRRASQIDSLRGRKWDAVIDPSAYFPRVVHEAMDILAQNIGYYMIVSSISVYANTSQPGIDETAPVGRIDDPSSEEVRLYYGQLKALAEEAAEQRMPGRVNRVRPGLIVGPGDPSDRFTYWPVRVQQGGEILSPGDPNDPVQYIDVRDLAKWMVHATEQRITGIFNATGPDYPTTVAEMLYGCKAVTGGDARFTWAPADFLEANGVQGWLHMPVWVPPVGDYAGFARIDCGKAIKEGMTFRPLAEIVRGTLDWWATLSDQRRARLAPDTDFPAEGEQDAEVHRRSRQAGLTASREREVLDAWHSGAKPND